MSTSLTHKTSALFATAAALVALVVGCSSTMGSDNAGHQMSSGIAETRSGLSQTQTGVSAIAARSRDVGMENIANGMSMMNQGVTDMRQGMSMMSGNMMMSCAGGTSDSILTPLQEAMDEMKQGQAMMGADAGASDDEGLAHMQNGMSMMDTALDQAQTSMNCMGHQGMMFGGMM